MTFMLKTNVKPSEALEAAHGGLSLIGCGEACTLALYESIPVWGKAKFDALFVMKDLRL